jgi:N-methylhydantoinase A/oxoprolinase/acetone carboxylase beta subunit
MVVIDNGARIGVDVGGTFTDVILHRADGTAAIRKVLSTPPNYDAAVVEATAVLAADAVVDGVAHGTTVATNAVLERRGAVTALVTTEGFRDVLELRRLRIPRMYEPFWRKPEPLVPRRLRLEIGERMAADGTVLRPLDEAEARQVAGRLRDAGVESVAVCLLHSYLYPDHEQRLGAILRAELPGVVVSLSSEILREQREYERTATTVVNAYVRPLMERYVGDIRAGLDASGIDAALTLMQSSGGVMTADDAKARPVLALESGPAAGVVASLETARRLGYENAIAFDMGGTTAKASLIERGAVSRGREYEVGGSLSAGSRLMRGSGELLRIPTIDIAEVGAGGGSIAWRDAGGGLQVGPRSAGADPGPACYGRGGTQPTVTDANVFLGLVPEGPLADGEITVQQALAAEALEPLAAELDLTPAELASGIHAIANARMMRALRSVSSEKGRDPRDFALIAYGGAGPVHAAGLAEDLGCRVVLVPPLAGLFSAMGLLYARPEFHEVRAVHLDARTVDGQELDRIFAELARRCLTLLIDYRSATPDSIEASEGLDHAEVSDTALGLVRTAELRYDGQTWEIEVEASDPADPGALIEAFEDEHERLYGVRGEPGAPIDIRALRLAALGPSRPLERLELADGFTPSAASRETMLGDLPVRARASIGEAPEPGPMLVDEYDTTVVVRPGWTVRRDPATETLVLERT